VQIAFNKSATFRRDDEMLQQGFAGLGFTAEQVDQFLRKRLLCRRVREYRHRGEVSSCGQDY